LGDRRRRPDRIEPGVVVPGAGQPVGRERARQRPSDHEPEVARPGARDQPRIRDRCQVVDDLARGLASPGQRAAHRCHQLIVAGARPDAPRREAVEEVRGELGGLAEEGASVGHREPRGWMRGAHRTQGTPWTDVESSCRTSPARRRSLRYPLHQTYAACMEGFVAERYDAGIIGGGHNGLVSAAYLARAGMKTLVLEQRHVLGGAAVTEELFPGFRFSVFSYVVSLLRPEIIRELQLPRHGLDILPLDGTFTPLRSGEGPKNGGGDYLWRVNDHGRTVRELRRWSATDAEAYEEYGQLMVEMARFIKPILGITPPDLTSLDPRPLLPLGGLLRSFQQLPERQQAVFVQLMTMSAADFLDQWFETDSLKATMSASGIIGTYLGVRSPGTAYVLLHHYMGEIDGAFRAWGIPKGGTGGVSNAIGNAARALGAEIRTEAPVERVIVRDGRAVGVVLAGSGEEILTDVVLSSVDARRTYLSLLESGTLEAGFEEEVRRFKFRGSS